MVVMVAVVSSMHGALPSALYIAVSPAVLENTHCEHPSQHWETRNFPSAPPPARAAEFVVGKVNVIAVVIPITNLSKGSHP